MGHLAVLGCFIARFTDKLRHFFLMLREASKFGWMDECRQAYEEVRRYLTEPPILSNSQSSE